MSITIPTYQTENLARKVTQSKREIEIKFMVRLFKGFTLRWLHGLMALLLPMAGMPFITLNLVGLARS